MRMIQLLLLVKSVLLTLVTCGTFNVSDDYFYGIEWLGIEPTDAPDMSLNLPSDAESEPQVKPVVVLHSSDKEVFYCHLPLAANRHDYQEAITVNSHKSEMDLLESMFLRSPCTYKIESYWSYELCHGKHMRQFHEEPQSDGTLKMTEYKLGIYKNPQPSTASPESTPTSSPTLEKEPVSVEEPKKLLLHGKTLPYFERNYTDGTHCDLNNEPRKIAIRYVCQPSAKGELIDITETETCNYVAVVLTRELCLHPHYKPVVTYVNRIQCYAKATNPPSESSTLASPKPKALVQLEEEASTRIKTAASNLEGLFGRDTDSKDTIVTPVRVESIQTKDATIVFKIKPMSTEDVTEQSNVPVKHESETKDPVSEEEEKAKRSEQLKDFLAGQYCIVGGTGWWKHEFCFQKSVLQFHDEPGEDRKVIVIGLWNKEKHLQFMRDNPFYRPSLPAEKRLEIHHMYTGGEVCPETKKKRKVMVTLKCSENGNYGIGIDFREPHVCNYVMQITSALFCSLIKSADENGLFATDAQLV